MYQAERKPHLTRKNGMWFCASGRSFPAFSSGESVNLAYTRWKWAGMFAPSWKVLPSAKDKP